MTEHDPILKKHGPNEICPRPVVQFLLKSDAANGVHLDALAIDTEGDVSYLSFEPEQTIMPKQGSLCETSLHDVRYDAYSLRLSALRTYLSSAANNPDQCAFLIAASDAATHEPVKSIEIQRVTVIYGDRSWTLYEYLQRGTRKPRVVLTNQITPAVEPADPPCAQRLPVTARPTPSGDEIEVTLNTPVSVRVALTENDVFNWITRQQDPAVLRRLGKYALRSADGIEHGDDDDFRSRA